MSVRRVRPGEYPNLLATDVVSDGAVLLFRNPAGRLFGEKDVFTLSAPWQLTEDIPEAYRQISAEERNLARTNNFAWSPEFGYLSPFPGHCGTGLVVQADLHLEGLHIIGDLPPVLAALDALRLDHVSVDMDGIRQAAHRYLVFNDSAIGLDEQTLLSRVQTALADLIEQENNARKALVSDHPRLFEDAVCRSLALLREARLLSPGEFFDLLSPLRLASIMGFLGGITRREIETLMKNQRKRPDMAAPQTEEEERVRDRRDADIADHANQRFATVGFNDRAQEVLS